MASKFKFNLEAVRKLRKTELNEQRRIVAATIRALGAAQRRVHAINESLRGNLTDAREAQSGSRPNVTLLRSQRFYLGWLHRQLIEASEDQSATERSLQEQRKELARRNARYKAIQKLHDKRLQRHQRDVARRQCLELDEIAVQQFLRHRRADNEDRPEVSEVSVA